MKRKKRLYKAVPISQVGIKKLREQADKQDIIVGIDVAKKIQFCAFSTLEGEILLTLKFSLQLELRQFVQLLKQLSTSSLKVAMEPTGTYGDPIRALLLEHSIPVYRVNPKKVHDYKEIYDGVPSNHDAKSAALIASLHSQGHSTIWPLNQDEFRELNGAYNELDLFAQQEQHHIGKLEGVLARYWPEITSLLELKRPTLLELLAEFGGPEVIAKEHNKARILMKSVGRNFLKESKIEDVLMSAKQTIGVKMVPGEKQFIMMLASEIRRAQKKQNEAQKKFEALGEQNESIKNLSKIAGKKTAAILVLKGGNPEDYESAGSYLKALGLNLSEVSSGESKRGGPHISKRGNSVVRKYLFMCVLRWIKEDSNSWARVWYQSKQQRDGGKNRLKGIVALMRKFVKGLWSISRGAVWDESKLFDVEKLKKFTKQNA